MSPAAEVARVDRNIAGLLLRPAEVALALAIGRTRVYELMATGELESVVIGRSRRVPCVALEAFVENLRHGAADP